MAPVAQNAKERKYARIAPALEFVELARELAEYGKFALEKNVVSVPAVENVGPAKGRAAFPALIARVMVLLRKLTQNRVISARGLDI